MCSINITHALLLLMVLKICASDRRILQGRPTDTHKRYMVYLLKAPQSLQQYDNWLCGGAIVSPEYIVTSAACIEDVQYMFAIAGYDKYVQKVESDSCTKATKKKIIFTCVPKPYELDYVRVEKWAYIDIGIAKVESEYDFSDKTGQYGQLCSWVPNKIDINFESKHQENDKDAYVIGWGAKEKMRQVGDTANYNSEKLQYAPTKIYDKTECMKAYEDYAGLPSVIDKYMICTMDAGNIDELGNIIKRDGTVDGCAQGTENKNGENTVNANKLLLGYEDEQSFQDPKEDTIILLDETRRNASDKHSRLISSNDTVRNSTVENMNGSDTKSLRRQGICQNDHGGPLVSWVGAHEVLIGVASVFRINNDSTCTGPFLFTSTYCASLFLDCIINGGQQNTRRNALCDQTPEEKGFHLIERSISWINHPAGPAENEIQMRPQVPLHEV